MMAASILSGFSFGRSATPRAAPTSAASALKRAVSRPETRSGEWILAEELPAAATEHDPTLDELNSSLQLLSDLFPDVQPEVFRELLSRTSRESRTEIITNHLLQDKNKWVKDRYKPPPPADSSAKTLGRCFTGDATKQVACERFRSAVYQKAVKDALYDEFVGLSHASIKAVLAEKNHSYTNSRPVLQQLSTKSWRFYFSNLWIPRERLNDMTLSPLVNWQTPYGAQGIRIPYLKHTSSKELDHEIYSAFIAPVLQEEHKALARQDANLARQLNETDAAKMGSLFECECCYASVTFEEVVACSSGQHIMCKDCVRRTINEAMFGQGWAKTIDTNRGSVRCFASAAHPCDTCLPHTQVRDAIQISDDGHSTWHNFEHKLARQNLEASGLSVIGCPFCAYVEHDADPKFEFRLFLRVADVVSKKTRLAIRGEAETLIKALIYVVTFGFYYFVLLFLALFKLFSPKRVKASVKRVKRRRDGLRFDCKSPRCLAQSCSACFTRWTDPHVCYEASTISLRHAVEAATTAVVKRTCPKCNTSFVKSSGCNKLVCPCGYTMCYICRSPIGKEGYAHFCQHFRAMGGACNECDRCDLYQVRDEDAIVRKAAKDAERQWRQQQGLTAAGKSGSLRHRPKDRYGKVAEEMVRGRRRAKWWTVDEVLDWVMEIMLA